MEVRTAASPKDVKHYTTDRLREEFQIQDLFQADKINLVYSHIDRIITGAAVPVNEKLVLTAGDELRAEYFLQRRELGIINIGGDGIITIDGRVYEVNARDGMYVGRGSKDISFENMKTAIIKGSALASFCVEKFGTSRMKEITQNDIEDRMRQFVDLVNFDIELANSAVTS